jgi:hypothetical protein
VSAELRYKFAHASGLHMDACSTIVHRWAADWSLAVDTGESFVGEFRGDENGVAGPVPFLYTGLWRSETGVVHASHLGGAMHTRARDAGAWSRHEILDAVHGVWGLRDDCVYAWGDEGGRAAMRVFDGTTWRAMQAPPSIPTSVHGIDPSLLMSVSSDGSIARFDGNTWRPMSSPVTTSLSSVYVVSPDEAYACGPYSPLLEGSIYGWASLIDHPGALHAVAKWRDRVYVAAGASGLLVEDGGSLKQISDLEADRLDARGVLLITARDRIAQTQNGSSFEWWEMEGVREACAEIATSFG